MLVKQVLTLLTQGSVRAISDLSYQLLDQQNSAETRTLLASQPAIQQACEQACQRLQTEDDGSIQAATARILRFLAVLQQRPCRCAKYDVCDYAAYAQAQQGWLEILADEGDASRYESNILCACTECGQRFQVFECEAGFGRRSTWQRVD